MSRSQIFYMYVVASASSVRRVIVIAENMQFFTLSGCHFHNQRQQVLRIFFFTANTTVSGIANRVEIAQSDVMKIFNPAIPVHHLLYCHFCIAVKAHRIKRMLFIQRQIFGHSVNRRSRRKHHIFNAGIKHGVKNIYRTADIILRIKLRIFH